MKNIQVTIRVDYRIWKKLKKIADKDGKSLAAVTRKAFKNYFTLRKIR